MPAFAQKCIQSWREKLPDYDFVQWNENNFDIESSQYAKEAYLRRRFAFVADYVRLHALYNHGGIYLDTDVEIIKKFDDLLSLPAFMGHEGKDLSLGTAVMGSERKGKWAGEVLSCYKSRRFIQPDGSEDHTTNVDLITEFIRKKGVALDGSRIDLPDYLTIFPKDFFSPKNWNDTGFDFSANTRAIHHFSGTWHDWRERTLMHIGQSFGAKTAHYIDCLWKPPPELMRLILNRMRRLLKTTSL